MIDNRTIELREKLDKLGIEHLDIDLPNNKQTRWNKGVGGWGACYVEITNGSILPADSIIDICTLRIYDCTPEQAIAVTLGRDASAARLAERLHGIADEMRSVGASTMTPHELLACYANEVSKVADSLVFATISGSGTLTAEQVRELITPHLHARPTFDFGHHGAVWEADFQAIADELNAGRR